MISAFGNHLELFIKKFGALSMFNYGNCNRFNSVKLTVATALVLATVGCGAEEKQSLQNLENLTSVEKFERNEFSQIESSNELTTNQTATYAPLANLIARRAANQNIGKSLGQCWKYTNDAVTGRGGARMGMYAVQFPSLYSEAQMKNLFGLCHLRATNGSKLLNISYAPVGSVIGYAPGMHGFNSKWGHGEIKVSSSRYCSDFCANRGSLAASMILVPCAKGAYNGL
jgi:hypothetical protein